jgi:hypothetical protein
VSVEDPGSGWHIPNFVLKKISSIRDHKLVLLICMSERIGIFLYQKWMTQNMISKFPNKTTKLCTDQRVISLYFKVFSALRYFIGRKKKFFCFLNNIHYMIRVNPCPRNLVSLNMLSMSCWIQVQKIFIQIYGNKVKNFKIQHVDNSCWKVYLEVGRKH